MGPHSVRALIDVKRTFIAGNASQGTRGRRLGILLAWLLLTGGVLVWAYWCERPALSLPQRLVMGMSAPNGTARDSIADSPRACTFEYPGRLRAEDLNCFLEYFPNSAPVAYPGPLASSWRTYPAGARRFYTMSGVRWEGGPPPVPIFIIFKDRVSILLEMLRSLYRHLRTPYEIVLIHDNSTYPGAVRFIDRLKDSGVFVYENARPWEDFDEFYDAVADCVDHYMRHSESEFYVLSDPDCALDSVPWDMLAVYQSILQDLHLDVVGAALRWDDFPEGLRGAAYEDTIARLPAQTYTLDGRNYYYIEAQVDTTFAMYRKGPRLVRFAGKHVRMLPPLGARHLDFYFDKSRLPPDYSYYHAAARKKEVNHMSHLD